MACLTGRLQIAIYLAELQLVSRNSNPDKVHIHHE